MGKLTAKTVEHAASGMHSDGAGLYLQVDGKGASWLLRYRFDGKQRYMGLGSAGAITLKRARELAAEARRLKAEGVDPIEHRRKKRAADKAETAKGVTFRDVAQDYIASHEAGWRNAVHRQQWRATLEQYVYPHIGGRPVAGIVTADIMLVLRDLWSRAPETASRVRGRIEVILDAAKVAELREGENPARWRGHLKHLLPAVRKVKPVVHHPAVPWEEMPAFMAALRARTSLSARALEFTILTATRASEACDAAWSEIDLGGASWTIPPSRMKAYREHRIPLVGRSLALLEAYGEVQRQGHVFPSYRGKPISRAAPDRLLHVLGRSETIHGFRATFRTWVAEATSFPRELAEVSLAHLVGDETERSYQRGALFERRRELMQAWDAYCGKP